MKKIMIPVMGLFTCFLFSCKSKNTPAAKPQNNDYIVSMNGVDSLKIGMSKADLEKMLNTKFTLKHINVDGGPADTFNIKYKGMDMMIYLAESDSAEVAKLYGILTSNPSCKTASGLGVGSDKIKVIDNYPDNKKYIVPEYEEYPVRSTTKFVVAVMDTVESHAIQFHLVNKKVVSMEVNYYYEIY